MCIIAVIPQGKKIDDETFFTMWTNNPDGAGMMFIENRKVRVIKEFYDSYRLWKEYLKASKLSTPIVLHFRIATSGKVNGYNIHPFKVHDGLYFCHNGILDIEVPVTSKENDTQIFNNSVLKHLPQDFIYNKGINRLLYSTIGRYNKFVFINDAGFIKIINKRAGIIDSGVWFSNKGYIPYVPPQPIKTNTTWSETEFFNTRPFTKLKTPVECEGCLNLSNELTYVNALNMDVCANCYSWMEEEKTQNRRYRL